MRYSLLGGGKRLRPALALAASEAVAGEAHRVLPLACAIEFIHTYSLIHDDLPVMDNDDYRRGRLTLHRVYGEGMAVLAGDALLTEAFAILAETAGQWPDLQARYLEAMVRVARASGRQGMIGGQVVDLESEEKEFGAETLEYIHAHKTGALIQAAVWCGALIGGASRTQLAAMDVYGWHYGLAFQITDDILDVVGSRDEMGKDMGSDRRKQKATYPALYGVERSVDMAAREVEKAVAALEGWGPRADLLREAARSLVYRRR
ncbi:MAG: polyprenyl synthetase family protein [Clostridia bacterium]|nr:MAG: polyprenyl synthetase family protein [Clostridia bacterium]